MTGMSTYFENAIGNAIRGNSAGTSFTAPTHVYVKLHIGDPGAACTSNAAGNTSRQEIIFGAASGGVITSTNAPAWTNVSTSETYSHFSLWDDPTAGNALGSGALTASKAIIAADSFTLNTGVTYTFT
jgi:hypothetical protein